MEAATYKHVMFSFERQLLTSQLQQVICLISVELHVCWCCYPKLHACIIANKLPNTVLLCHCQSRGRQFCF